MTKPTAEEHRTPEVDESAQDDGAPGETTSPARSKAEPGVINLLGVFSAAAASLLGAVEQGRILGFTKNIADSGAPLEHAVRALFRGLLPPVFLVHHGYLFDTESRCTPQIDVVVSDARRAQLMLQTPDGASYSAAADAYVIGEIKNSGRRLKSNLEQLGKQVASARAMRDGLPAWISTRLPELVAFMVVGDCDGADDAVLRDYWASQPADRPDYILLLKRGQLLMSHDAWWDTQAAPQDEASPRQLPRGNEIGVYELGETLEAKRGNALMWLYYALRHRLQLSQAFELERAFRELAAPEGSLDGSARRAAERLSNTADPFAAAMVQAVKLKRVRSIEVAAAGQC